MTRPRRPTLAFAVPAAALLLGAAVLATVFGGVAISPSARPGTGPVPGSPAHVLALVEPDGPPTLTLTPSPSAGSPPLAVTATVGASGGAPPYTVDVCFGTIDHTSPTVPCGTTQSDWTGVAPLNFTHLYPTPGNFSVIALLHDSGGAGAGATALIVVTTTPVLTAAATEAGSSGTAPLAVVFNDTVSGGTPPIAIQWVFGDGSFASGLPGTPVTHVYREAGRFDPSFVVTDGAGHRNVQALPTVSVAGGGWSTSQGVLPGDSWWWDAGAALSVTLLLGALAIRIVQNRRWRREGNELVEEAIRGDPPSGPRPPSP